MLIQLTILQIGQRCSHVSNHFRSLAAVVKVKEQA